MKINTNLQSLMVQKNLSNSTTALNTAIERMTTGYKINHASDNAANYSISQNMTSQIQSYQVAEENTSMGLDMVQTASDSLSEIERLSTRLRALAVQAQNGTMGKDSISAINQEAAAITDEIMRIASNTGYNGIDLLKNEIDSIDISAIGLTEELDNIGADVQVKYGNFIENARTYTAEEVEAMTALSSIDAANTITEGQYKISSAEELAQLATMTNSGKITGGEFVLSSDIDLSAYKEDGGWVSIGTSSKKFQAVFNGNGHTVNNLYLDKETLGYQGLFGYVSGGTVKNVGVTNFDITAKIYSAGVVGYLTNEGTVSNCYATGTVHTTTKGAAGLVGMTNNSSVQNSYANVEVFGQGWAGGLIGQNYNNSTVENCFAIGNVTQINYQEEYTGNVCGFLGGLIGINQSSGSITNCYATGDISAQSNAIGGFLGGGNPYIENCHSTGNVYVNNTVEGETQHGGFCGRLQGGGTAKKCYSTGNVISNEGYCGGFIGSAYDSGTIISDCYSTGNVISKGEACGSFVGFINELTLSNCFATGNVTATGAYVGGLIGAAGGNSVIKNSYSTGNVESSGYEMYCHGGFIGYLYGTSTVDNCYSTGNVKSNGYNTGGFVGNISGESVINNSFSTGNVFASVQNAGGFVGLGNGGSIANCYSYGNVSSPLCAGGFAGKSYINLDNCFSYGSVSGETAIGAYIGYLDTAGTISGGFANSMSITNAIGNNISSTSTNNIADLSNKIQVGIKSTNSQIRLGGAFCLAEAQSLTKYGIQDNGAIDRIDNFINRLSEQQTMYGATVNRLESALESISISYNNIISSRSTIKDVDMAKVSSQYIRQQILQQASATLLSTANQSPALTLQLIGKL